MDDWFDHIGDVLVVFRIIGTFIRWASTGFRGSFTNRLDNNIPLIDHVLGILFVVLFVIALKRLLH